MSSFRFIIALAVLAVACRTAAAIRPAPTFTVDLAKPPQERWRGAVGTVLALHPWEASFGALVTYYTTTAFNLVAPSNRSAIEAATARRFPDHYLELAGIAADFAANGHPEVDVAWLCMWLWFHELSHAQELGLELPECTAILALPMDPSLPVVHGRNFDQSPLAARNLTLQITYVNSSLTIYPSEPAPILFQAAGVYWMSGGFVTGFKTGSVTLQENWRFNAAPRSLAEILARIVTNDATIPQSLMFRFALSATHGASHDASFDAVVQFINQSSYAAPFYAIVSGTQRRGAVVTVFFEETSNRVLFLGSADFPHHSWYIVQTNYDQWAPDTGRLRRTHAEQTLDALGQQEGATRLGVWQTLSAWPVHNQYTFYSVVMDVSMPGIRALIRQPMQPYNASCPPAR